MRDYSPVELTYLQSRSGYVAKALLWFSARNRTTNAVETIGLWNGDDDATFTIAGDTRTYLSAGEIVGIDPIIMQTGLVVRTQRLRLAAFSPAMQQAVLVYDLSLAPCQIHRALFSPETGALIAEPRRLWSGFVDHAPLPTAAQGEQADAEVILSSAAQRLTRGLSLTWSDSTQKQRGGDAFLKYADVAGVVRSPWGQNLPGVVTAPPQPVTYPPSRGNSR